MCGMNFTTDLKSKHVRLQEWQDTVRAAVLRGERALLYTISFDFKVSMLSPRPLLPYWK